MKGNIMDINLRKDAPDQTDKVDVNELSEAIEQFKSIGSQILAVDIKLKELKSQEKYISEFVIPEIMNKQNLKTLKLKDGSELSVKNRFFASIKADKKAEAIKWLRDNGLGDIVDNNIVVSFGQGEDNKAVEYAGLARERGYEPTQDEKVHHARLSAVMSDLKSKNFEIPTDLFSSYEKISTSITNKK
tara:strand:+ start:114 stop:677 length:564 start_codon:yes stop_codon:yes gene_type:complete